MLKNILILFRFQTKPKGGFKCMYYNEEELERMKKKGEEYLRQEEEEKKGYKYKSEAELQIRCMHCKYEYFEAGEALLNTRGMTFLDLDWLNNNATTLICKRCGYIHWFNKQVKKIKE